MEQKLKVKQIKGFPDYAVTSSGTILSFKKNNVRVIKSTKRYCDKKENDYEKVHLYLSGKRYACYVHRLVYSSFNDDMIGALQINHKDFDKSNNNLSNLELVTSKENTDHYWNNKNGIKQLEDIIVNIKDCEEKLKKSSELSVDELYNVLKLYKDELYNYKKLSQECCDILKFIDKTIQV